MHLLKVWLEDTSSPDFVDGQSISTGEGVTMDD